MFLKNVHLQEGNPQSKLTFFGIPGISSLVKLETDYLGKEKLTENNNLG